MGILWGWRRCRGFIGLEGIWGAAGAEGDLGIFGAGALFAKGQGCGTPV